MKLFYKIMWYVFRWPSVYLVDHDKEVTIRLLRYQRYGAPWASRLGLRITDVILMEDGTCLRADSGRCTWVKSWSPAYGPKAFPFDNPDFVAGLIKQKLRDIRQDVSSISSLMEVAPESITRISNINDYMMLQRILPDSMEKASREIDHDDQV